MVELAEERGRPSLGDAIVTMSWLSVRRQNRLASDRDKTLTNLYFNAGAPGRNRTNTSVRKPDFETGRVTRSYCWITRILSTLKSNACIRFLARKRPRV